MAAAAAAVVTAAGFLLHLKAFVMWPHISGATSDCVLVACAHLAKMKLIAAQLCGCLQGLLGNLNKYPSTHTLSVFLVHSRCVIARHA